MLATAIADQIAKLQMLQLMPIPSFLLVMKASKTWSPRAFHTEGVFLVNTYSGTSILASTASLTARTLR
jgi:hypothetical protein